MPRPLLLALGTAALLAGCGGASADRPNQAATLALDGAPAAIDAGIALAVARDYTGAEGVALTVRPVRARGGALRMLRDNRAQLAVLDIHDLARARERGADIVGVMAIAQRPLAGRFGIPAVRDRRGRRVDTATAPPYPEIVMAATRTTVEENPALVRATVAALQRGYREALVDPDSAVEALLEAFGGLRRAAVSAGLDAVQGALQAPDGTVGTLDRDGLRAWARWEARAGITRRAPEVALAFEPRFARAGAKRAAETSG